MKTFLKLNIIFVLIMSGFIFAASNNSGVQKEVHSGQKLNTFKIHQVSYSDEELICFDGIDQLDYNSQLTYTNIFIDTPASFGEFKKYFSTQTLLPDIRTEQRFSGKLRI